MSEIKHQYFTVGGTALTIHKPGANAIYCGDAPRKNTDGTTSHSLRAPLLIMPPDMFSSEVETLEMIAQALNENASLFYPSANKEVPPTLSAAMQLPEIKALVEALELAANRLHRCAVDYDTGTLRFYETCEWTDEACAALAAIKETKT